MRFVVLLCVLGALCAGAFFFRQSLGMGGAFDRSAPHLAVLKAPAGLGRAESKLTVGVEDADSGISTIEIEILQGEKRIPVFQEAVTDSARRIEREVGINVSARGLEAGDVKIILRAKDASWWSNEAQMQIETGADFTPPQLEILTLQHAAKQAGCEVVIVKASDATIRTVGARVGEREMLALRGRDFDPALDSDDLFAVVIPLPYEFDAVRDGIEIFARDRGGNESRQPVHFRLEHYRQPSDDLQLKPEFVSNVVSPLLAEYREFLERLGSAPRHFDAESIPAAEQFRLINGEFRAKLEERLQQLFSAAPTPRKWKSIFQRPLAGTLSSTFGEMRTYFVGGSEFGKSVHHGVDLAATERAPVLAAQAGTVVMAEMFGIYGNTVVIDHGAGVHTLYGHLSGMDVVQGSEVTAGQSVGRSGRSGFAGGDHLHFEVRVYGVPVTPIEWWDEKWFADNVDLKIAQARERAVTP